MIFHNLDMLNSRILLKLPYETKLNLNKGAIHSLRTITSFLIKPTSLIIHKIEHQTLL